MDRNIEADLDLTNFVGARDNFIKDSKNIT